MDTSRHRPSGIELLETADTSGNHPVDVLPDTVFCNIGIHPMPPDADAGLLGRIAEILLVGLRKRSYGRHEDGRNKTEGFHFSFVA